jgi:16S rRNA processing protein RimM
MSADRLIVVGKALKPIGFKGELKIYPYTESLDIFKNFSILFFEKECFEVNKVRFNKNLVAVCLKGVDSFENAKKLSGQLVRASSDYFPDKENDEYYWFELIGLTVYDIQGKALGNVQSLLRTSAHDVLQVQTKTKEILIPLVDEIVKTVDLEGNQIVVDLLTGMGPDD